MENIDQIKESLKAFRDKLEVDYKPLKIRYIKLETSTNHKLSLIENNKALAQRLPHKDYEGLDLYKHRPEAFKKDLDKLIMSIHNASKQYNYISKRLIQSNQYEKVAKLKSLKEQLVKLNRLCDGF